ncbi:MAG: N-acetylmuramoyl-L-alanine amidase, partial [Myxococcota bacterium]
MRFRVAVFAFFVFAPTAFASLPSEAARAYHAARTSYYALKGDEDAQRFRHHWRRVIEAFQEVVRRYPKSQEAPRALYTAASLTQDLYDVSRRPSDATHACALYERVHREHPKSSLADDALYEAAKLQRRRGQEAKARASLETLVREHRGGDMLGRARRMLKELGAPATTKALTKELRVVVDAGHGGKDSGAIGVDGLTEKKVNLDIARRLARILRGRGVRVTMTREDDSTVSLDARAKRANAIAADLMVSIHANAAPQRSARGLETYYLDVTHSRYAKRLAHRENADQGQGVELILADLATKVSTRESRSLASDIQRRLVRSVKPIHPKVRDLGAKPAMLH